MAGPFKMKGSPMARNFGIGSPVKQAIDPVVSDSTSTELTLKQQIEIENARLAEEKKKKKQKSGLTEGDILDFYTLGYLNKKQRNMKLKQFGYEIPDDK
tara:strand:+ start:376 stop:672 length:297 start_codon:yes stop_codon:yes gene_type:complete